jgi:hypothetical protein
MKPEPIIDQPAAERCQDDLRQALGRPDLPVIDVMVEEGAWVIRGEQPAGAALKGVA